MKVKRRVPTKDGGYREVIEEVTLVLKNKNSVLVKLKNGDMIKRKIKDIINE